MVISSGMTLPRMIRSPVEVSVALEISVSVTRIFPTVVRVVSVAISQTQEPYSLVPISTLPAPGIIAKSGPSPVGEYSTFTLTGFKSSFNSGPLKSQSII